MKSKCFFSHEDISKKIIRITGISGEMMYLIKGSKRNVLIDCGVGIGHLREYINNSIGIDADSVILTHGHIDHIGGAAEFEHVYINPLDNELARSYMTKEKQLAHLYMCGIDSKNFEVEDYCEFKGIHFEDIIPGQLIDLGDVKLHVLDAHGHTKGQVAILIPDERVLIAGDSCNSFVFLFLQEATTVKEYKEMLEEMRRKTNGSYDRVLVCHGSGEEDKDIISKVIDVCDDIMGGRSDDIPFSLFGQSGYIAKAVGENNVRLDGGSGNIVYNGVATV